MGTDILIIEQNSQLETALSRLAKKLEDQSFNLFPAHDALEAIQIMEQHPSITMALLLFPLPHAHDEAVFRQMCEESPVRPVIALIPNADLETVRLAMNQGAFDFLNLPVDDADLEITIQKALRHVRKLTAQGAAPDGVMSMKQIPNALETMRLGVTITDLHGRILYTNPAEAHMHGYTVEELIGQDVHLLAPPELRHPMTLEQIRDWGGSIRESVNIRRDGARFPVWLMSDIVKDIEGQPFAIVTSCEDISERKQAEELQHKHQQELEHLVQERTKELTAMNRELQQEVVERKHAEEALRESEAEYRLLFENLPDMFYRITRDGNLLLTTPSIQQFLGYSVEEAIGLNFGKDVFVYPEQWDDFVSLMETDGHLENFEVLMKRSDGSYEWGNMSAQLYNDHEGQLLGFEGIIRDFSVRKQAEMELMAAHDALQQTNVQLQELNASKDKFFSIISHDLRSQFATLLGFTELLEAKADVYTPQRLKELLRKLNSSAERLYALFENLLTWSRLQRGAMQCEPEAIHLFPLAEENVEIMRPKGDLKQIRLYNNVPKLLEIYVDASMISTVLRNLLSNALKFTENGGRITVSAELREQEVVVAVTDTGCGMEEEALDQIFRIDTTYTTKGTAGEHGTGLGLILCKELVEKNGGRIWVESELHQGTTFFFSVPAPK